MDSQGSVSSVVSEIGRDWLDLIVPAPTDYLDNDVEHLEATVRTYFDFQVEVEDTDDDADTELHALEEPDDNVEPLHEDDWLDLRTEDVKETVVSLTFILSAQISQVSSPVRLCLQQ